MGAQISSLSVFAIVPLLGALLLWSKSSRFGGILILGSLPSSVLYLIMDRFVEKRIAMAPAVPVPGWQLTYNVLYVLVIACAAVGALLAAQFLREFHREEKRPPA
jgi:hypothetical protein